MEHIIDCRVAMLPTDKARWDKGQLLKSATSLYTAPDINPIGSSQTTPQHLYFTSDEEIKKGAWYMNIVAGWIRNDFSGGMVPNVYKKIVASTDPSLGLPLIPQSFLQKYAECNGKITEVKLKQMLDPYEHYLRPIVDGGEVVVVSDAPLITYTSEFQELISKSEDKELEDVADNPYPKSSVDATIYNAAYKKGYNANPNKWTDEDVAALIKERFNTGANWSPKVLAKWLEEYKNNKK